MEVFQQVDSAWHKDTRYCFCFRIDDIECYYDGSHQFMTTDFTELSLQFLREV